MDEIPGAYKDIDVVMAQQQDLVEVVATLRQVMCVKGRCRATRTACIWRCRCWACPTS
jgi:hypothetical protein